MLRERGFDSATTETMEFLNAFNHFVKETEEVGITHTKINWKKMFTSSGGKDKTYWKTLKSELDKVSTDKLNALIEKIQILIKYEKNVKNFSEDLDNYAKNPLYMGEFFIPVGTVGTALKQLQLVARPQRDALGLTVWAVLSPMIDSAQTLLGPLLPDMYGHYGPTEAPNQTELAKFKRGAEQINNQSAKVLTALKTRLEQLKNEANSIYTSSRKVTTEKAARENSELLQKIKEAKTNPSKEVIISIMNLVKKQAPVGLGAVADQVIAALNTAGHSPAPAVADVSRSSQSTKTKPASVAAPPQSSMTHSMNRSAPPKRSVSPNKSDLSDSSYGSPGSSRRSANRSNSPNSNQRPANRKDSSGNNGNSNKTKKKKSSFIPNTTPV